MSNKKITAFFGVNVIPMDSEQVIKDQTVIVENDMIKLIGSSNEIKIDDDSFIIECDNKYLVPGLIDMHVHITQKNDLKLFLAKGVTTVRNMWGYSGMIRSFFRFPNQLKMREKINEGKLLGPIIYTAGPILEGSPPANPFMPVLKTTIEAEKAVRKQKELGYDFVKVYDNLIPEVYETIIKTAKELKIPVIGHTPLKVGIDKVLKSGQHSVEHFTGYIDPDAATFTIPETELEDYAKKSQECEIWNCPTIVIWQKRVPFERLDEVANKNILKLISRKVKIFWGLGLRSLNKSLTYRGDDYHGQIKDIDLKMVKALHDAKANLILGTDAGNPFVIPGFSIHEELSYMVEAGLNPFEAIKMGTYNAAKCLNKLGEIGTIKEGKRADIVLVEKNPLNNIDILTKPAGVMVRGKWFSEDDLNSMLIKIAK